MNTTNVADSIESRSKNRSKLSVNFRARETAKGLSVNVRIGYNGKTIDKATGITCKRNEFKNGKVKGNLGANQLMSEIENNLKQAYYNLQISGKPIDLQTIAKMMDGNPPETPTDTAQSSIPLLFQAMDIYVQSKWLDDGVDLKDVTKLKSKRYFNHLKQWAKHYFGREDIELHEIKPIHDNEIVKFMKHHRKAGNDHAMRHVQRFKGFFDYAIGNDWIVKNPFMNFKGKMESKEIVSVSKMELSALEKADFMTGTTYDLVRDLFVFSCYTGLGYADLKEVGFEHIKENQDGVKYLEIPRLKNEQLALIPLRNKPLELIEKYRFEDKQLKFFRVPTNQCMNDTIKQIAQMVGIRKVLTTHIARKTFGSLLKEDGVDIAIISKSMAHKNIQTTMKHYTNIQPVTIINAFSQILKNQ
jgi:integrase/recombinase XerD